VTSHETLTPILTPIGADSGQSSTNGQAWLGALSPIADDRRAIIRGVGGVPGQPATTKGLRMDARRVTRFILPPASLAIAFLAFIDAGHAQKPAAAYKSIVPTVMKTRIGVFNQVASHHDARPFWAGIRR
jgi:hypothetical protein